MSPRAAALALALGLLAPGAVRATGPETIVGSAEVKISGDGRGSAHVVFAASAEPVGLRLEVVRAGSVSAVVFCDAERLRVLVPGSPPVLHEAAPTRAAFEAALGLPFCLDELLFALRVGHAPAPDCRGEGAVPVEGRGGRIVGLRRESRTRGRPELLRFNRFRRGPDGEWPARAVLETGGSVATLLFRALRPHDRPPLDLDGDLVARARSVDAAGLRRVLGLDGEGR